MSKDVTLRAAKNVRPVAKFDLGRLIMTGSIHQLMMIHELNPLYYVGCHLTGNWGEVEQEDKERNEEALLKGGQLISEYNVLDPAVRIRITTEADRSCTTVSLPSD